MVGDGYRGRGIAEQCFEALRAFEIAELGERFAIGFEQVEGEEEQLGLLVLCAMATLQHRLQRREIGVAVLAIGDDLAVDQAGRQVERGDVADERREFVGPRSEEHTSELQSLMRISYAVFCLKQTKISAHK